jgi:hypothetical protein
MTTSHDSASQNTVRRPDPAPDRLAVYLNDHLAGATAGAGLAQRVANTQRGTSVADTLRQCATEISEDRAALIDFMHRLDIPENRGKVAAARLGEKLGRFKPNARLTKRSPASTVLELEMMRLGVEGKACGWQVLRNLADYDERLDRDRLDDLLGRARAQAETLENLRIRATTAAFTRLDQAA